MNRAGSWDLHPAAFMNRNAHRWSTKKYIGPKGYEAAKACLSSALKVKLPDFTSMLAPTRHPPPERLQRAGRLIERSI